MAPDYDCNAECARYDAVYEAQAGSPWCGPLPTCTTTANKLYSASRPAASSVVLGSFSSNGNTTRYISLRSLPASTTPAASTDPASSCGQLRTCTCSLHGAGLTGNADRCTVRSHAQVQKDKPQQQLLPCLLSNRAAQWPHLRKCSMNLKRLRCRMRQEGAARILMRRCAS